MLIVVDGPEKSGKGTFIRHVVDAARPWRWHVVEANCRYPGPDVADFYRTCLQLASRPDTLVVMNRSWVSEHVYSNLLARPTKLLAREAEYQLGRAVSSLGSGVILHDHPLSLALRRDGTDHGVDTQLEEALFRQYAREWSWPTTYTGRASWEEELAELAIDRVNACAGEPLRRLKAGITPRELVGHAIRGVAIVGEVHGSGKFAPSAAWLPLSGFGTRWLQDVVSPPYDEYIWTNAAEYEAMSSVRALVDECEVVVALGRVAAKTLRLGGYSGHVLETPHPAAAIRWGKLRDAWPRTRWTDAFRDARTIAWNIRNHRPEGG